MYRVNLSRACCAEWHIDLHSKPLATIVRRCQALPGHDLSRHRHENNAPHAVTSTDVNEYLGDITGEGIAAKDYPSGPGTNLAALTAGVGGVRHAAMTVHAGGHEKRGGHENRGRP